MSKITSKDTKPEMRIRRYLHARGFRYRLHVRGLPGTPDIVLPKYKMAIQVRGCFWHQHDCKDGRAPSSRKEYWIPKLTRTKERDAENDQKLVQMGWRLLVIWGCEIKTDKLMQEAGRQIIKDIKASL